MSIIDTILYPPKKEKKDKSDENLISYIMEKFRNKEIKLKKIDDDEIVFEKVKDIGQRS